MSENEIATTVKLDQSLTLAGFGSAGSFELLMRQAKMISSSSLVPEQYSIFDKKGNLKDNASQAYALANATIAMEMAGRIGASPLAVCQNLYIVQGRPSWSSQFVIAMVNACGRYSPLRFALTEPEAEREVVYEATEWENGAKKKVTYKEKIRNYSCYAWAIEKATGERLEGPIVSLEIAVKEGWMSKPGSKWKTMEGLMIRYRAAAFFGRLYAPELMMGIKTEEELGDIIDISPNAAPAGTSTATPAKGVKNKAAASILAGFEESGADGAAVDTETWEMELPAKAAEGTPCPECQQIGKHSDSCPLAEPPEETE